MAENESKTDEQKINEPDPIIVKSILICLNGEFPDAIKLLKSHEPESSEQKVKIEFVFLFL